MGQIHPAGWGFGKWGFPACHGGYPHSWMVFEGRSHLKVDENTRGTPHDSGNHQMALLVGIGFTETAVSMRSPIVGQSPVWPSENSLRLGHRMRQLSRVTGHPFFAHDILRDLHSGMFPDHVYTYIQYIYIYIHMCVYTCVYACFWVMKQSSSPYTSVILCMPSPLAEPSWYIQLTRKLGEHHSYSDMLICGGIWLPWTIRIFANIF